MKPFQIEFGTGRLSPALTSLLAECIAEYSTCIAEYSTRYKINRVKIENDKMIVTDGRRLLKLEITHNLKQGLYYLTSDGFLLQDKDGAFPKYQEILDPINKHICKHTVILTPDENILFYKIAKTGHAVNLEWLKKIITLLMDCGTSDIDVYIDPEAKGDKPIKLSGKISGGSFQYTQMPMSKN
jgi:hypothetical protein